MKKTTLVLLSIMVLAVTANCVTAKPVRTSPATSAAIKLYKAGNYTQSYTAFKELVEKDPSNALAYYYLGMTNVQLGRKGEAIENYNKAVELSPNGILGSYAKKGIACAENPLTCHETNQKGEEESPEDKFIKSSFGSGFSDQARNNYETQKIENLKREINRNDEIPPQKFRDFKDFSSSTAPTNDEIVAAIRTLQQAGLGNLFAGQSYGSELSYLLDGQNVNNQNGYEVLSRLINNKQSGNMELSPQLIQSLLTSQMTTNF